VKKFDKFFIRYNALTLSTNSNLF